LRGLESLEGEAAGTVYRDDSWRMRPRAGRKARNSSGLEVIGD
jgi:hypothetical protein